MYRAHDHGLGRDVAIKKLIARGNIVERRFFREASITARLEHPGIVSIHEAGWWSDGMPFYAMKLIAGRTLRDLIAERQTVEQRLGLLHHVIAVADAIAYAHGRNIIHRDLKPADVIVGDFGETVVIDWGLAKDISENERAVNDAEPLGAYRDDHLTSAGSVLGTPAYMSLEQALGRALAAQQRLAEAAASLDQSLAILEPLATKQRRVAIDRRLGRARAELARVRAASGAPPAKTRELATAALDWLRPAGAPPAELAELERLAAVTAH